MPLNLFGEPIDTYGGLLSPEAVKQAQKEAQLVMGLGLLGASGPSLTPSSFGQAFGQAGMAGIQARDAATQRALQQAGLAEQMRARKVQQEQQAQIQARLAGGDPAGAAAMGGDIGAYLDATRPMNPNGQNTPAAVAEYQFYASLPKDKQAEFLNVKRASQMFMAGGVPQSLAPSGVTTPLSTPQAEIEAKRTQSEAAAAGAAIGEKQGTAQMALPAVEASIGSLIGTIDKLEKHPGFSAVIGAKGPSAYLNFGSPVPGSDAAGAQALIEQIKGGAFLQAFEKLKGGGAIQEREGEKATQAMARLDQAQTESDFKLALKDLKDALNSAVETAQGKASAVRQSSATKVRKYNPLTGRIE